MQVSAEMAAVHAPPTAVEAGLMGMEHSPSVDKVTQETVTVDVSERKKETHAKVNAGVFSGLLSPITSGGVPKDDLRNAPETTAKLGDSKSTPDTQAEKPPSDAQAGVEPPADAQVEEGGLPTGPENTSAAATPPKKEHTVAPLKPNFKELMETGTKTTPSRFLYVLNRNPAKDPLKTGELGIDVFNCKPTKTLVSTRSMARFIIVTLSIFAGEDEQTFLSYMKKWAELVELHDTIAKEGDAILANAIKEKLESITRQFADQTYPRISAFKFLKTRGLKIDPIDKVKAWIDEYFEISFEAVERMQDELEFNAMVEKMAMVARVK